MAITKSNIIPLRNKLSPSGGPGKTLPDDLNERYGQGLRRYLMRMTHNQDDIDDLVQEAFCRVLRNDQFSHMANPGAFIFKTARNLFIDRYRRRRIEQELTNEELATGQELPTDLQESFLRYHEMVLAYQRALSELPERCRQVFLLRRYDGLSNAEIADRLKISIRMVQKHMIKALSHFQNRLGQ